MTAVIITVITCIGYLVYKVFCYSGKCNHRFSLEGLLDHALRGSGAIKNYDPPCMYCNKLHSECADD